MTNLMTIDHLSYQRNRTPILTDLSLTLPTGAIVGLLGANGTGKTTLMRLIAGIAAPHTQAITIAGGTAATERKAKVSYTAQVDGVPETHKVSQLAAWFEAAYPDFDPARFTALAADMNLDSKQRLNRLSKGNQRKVTIALTLARQAAVYLLDEPFDGIDSMARKGIIAGIIGWKPLDSTLVISDHHVQDVAQLLDDVVVLNNGRVVAHTRADDIRAQGLGIEDYYESFYLKGGAHHDDI